MKTFNIFGCCVSRGIFNQKNGTHPREICNVLQYVGLTSPMSIMQPKAGRVMDAEEIEDFTGKPFQHRTTVLDFNNSCFDYLRERSAEYLIVDVADVRLDIARFPGDFYLSCAMFYKNNVRKFQERFGTPVIYDFDGWGEDAWADCMNRYCDRILEMYPPDRIILNEALNVDEYVNKYQVLQGFTVRRTRLNYRQNARIRKCFAICAERLKGCHIIRMPEHVTADETHMFGLSPLHYHPLYYQYGFEAVEAITSGSLETETETLYNLREDYGIRFALLRQRMYANSWNLHRRLNEYARYFPALIGRYQETLAYVRAFCAERGIRRAGFYGELATTKVLIAFLRECGVDGAYIVGSRNIRTAFPRISPDAERFPEADALIICDIANLDGIRNKISGKVSCPIFTVYDVLPKRGAK